MDHSKQNSSLLLHLLKSLSRVPIIVVTALLACGTGTRTISAESDPAKDALRVAVVVPLSGPVAEYGRALKNGLILAQEEHPQLLAALRITFEDSRYDNQSAVSIVNKVAGEKSADLMYLWGYGPVQAAAPVAEARKLPLIAVSGEQGIDNGKRFVFRFCYRIEQFSEQLLRYLRSRGLKRFGFVKTEMAYMNSILAGMRSRLHSDEEIIEDSYLMGEQDFRISIERLKSKKVDAVGVFLVTGQVSQFFRQARDLHYQVLFFGASTFENKNEIAQAQGMMEGAVFPALDVDNGFRARYMKRFGDEVQLGWAANAYDFAMLSALRKDKLKDQVIKGGDIFEEYRDLKEYHGVEGMLIFKENAAGENEIHFPLVLKKIKGAGFETVGVP
jgi:ABC-type branched-subunit amino acid transport system substrate-binding protein